MQYSSRTNYKQSKLDGIKSTDTAGSSVTLHLDWQTLSHNSIHLVTEYILTAAYLSLDLAFATVSSRSSSRSVSSSHSLCALQYVVYALHRLYCVYVHVQTTHLIGTQNSTYSCFRWVTLRALIVLPSNDSSELRLVGSTSISPW